MRTRPNANRGQVGEVFPIPGDFLVANNDAWRRIKEHFRQVRLLQPQIVIGDDLVDVGWLTVDRDFTEPLPERQAAGERLIGRSILCFLRLAQLPLNLTRQELLDEGVGHTHHQPTTDVRTHQLYASFRVGVKSVHNRLSTIASMNAILLMRSGFWEAK